MKLIEDIKGWFSSGNWQDYLEALAIIAVGYALARLLSRLIQSFSQGRINNQQVMLLSKLTHYSVLALTLTFCLNQLGIDLKVLLGAAGIFTVAIGFASQTSASNLISGLFLLGEKPFVIGDIIQIDGTMGEVLGIDLLATRLRTFDNLLIRVPNETIIKTQFTNFTYFPLRRIDISMNIDLKADLAKVENLFKQVADKNPLCLQEPIPLMLLKGFGDWSIQVQFSVWAVRENFVEMRNSMIRDLQQAFLINDIKIPTPSHVNDLKNTGEPLSVRVVES